VAFDILIRNGRIVDGTGNAWFRADVGIGKGKIGALGDLRYEKGDQVLDASGLIVSPGFIDIHTHSDTVMLVNPTGDSHIQQGVTMNLMGNCGSSVAPVSEDMKGRYEETLQKYGLELDWSTLGEFLDRLGKRGVSLNVGSLVGNGTVRMAAMGMERREPTDKELKEMKKLVANAMKDGAFGLSTGLLYAPSGFAGTDEIVELTKVAAEYGGIYATHIRGEGDPLIQAVKEAIEIGERADVPVEIAHHKAMGTRNWGKVKETLELIGEARKRGVEVNCDVYAWRAGATGLSAVLPHWVHEGGTEKMAERLRNPETREKIKRDMAEGLPEWESFVHEIGWENIMISSCPSNTEYEGRMVAELASEKGVAPYDFAFDLLIQELGRVNIIAFGMSEEDVVTVMKSPYSMIGSDSSAVTPTGFVGEGKPHPRTYGNFVKVLGEYVRDREVLTLEEAVRKMSSLPAQKLGLLDRGILRKDAWADIVVFDHDTVASRATYTNPKQYPTGVKWVIVNGILSVENRKHTGVKAGMVLKRPRLL